MSGVNNLNGIEDPDQIEKVFKMSERINEMPEDISDRFKAIKTLYDECADLDEE